MEPPQPDPNRAEHRIIERLLAPRGPRPPWVRLDAGHDCAIVASEGELAITVDALVEGVHFARGADPADVGFKAVAVSVSDLGASRASPRWMVLALSAPDRPAPSDLDRWIDGFAAGVAAAADAFGVYLVGGDLTRMPADGPIVVSVTAAGAVVHPPRSRAGARPGDDVWVTGWPGLAGAGWMWADPPAEALAALHRPDPPLGFALALGVATAAMDLSDGLASDLPRLCARSGVGAVIDPDSLPVHPALADRSTEAIRAVAFGGGDDYQLLFTAAPADRAAVEADAGDAGVRVARIGSIVAEGGARLRDGGWPAPGFVHYGPEPAGRGDR
ncbi:MAG: thiamine-phosphate kinase [Myxococcota bacterium]